MTTTELERIHTEIASLMGETAKISRENTLWYPLVVAAGLIGGVATATTLIIKFL